MHEKLSHIYPATLLHICTISHAIAHFDNCNGGKSYSLVTERARGPTKMRTYVTLRQIRFLTGLAALALAPRALPAATPPGNAYLQHNLVADQPGIADFTDPNLINPWGIYTSSASPFWVNDAGTGFAP